MDKDNGAGGKDWIWDGVDMAGEINGEKQEQP